MGRYTAHFSFYVPAAGETGWDVTIGTFFDAVDRDLTAVVKGDIPPTTANAFDDEFDVDTGPSGSAVWSWLNQGAATYTISNGQLVVYDPTATGAASLRSLIKPISGTFDVSWPVMIQGNNMGNFSGCYGGLYDSGSGKLQTLRLAHNGGYCGVYRDNWTDSNTLASQTSVGFGPWDGFLRVKLDSTNLTWYFSRDGVEWTRMLQESKTAFLPAITHFVLGALAANTTAGNKGIIRWVRRV